MTQTTTKVHDLDIYSIFQDPDQPRKYFNAKALDELAKSIEKHGVLEPILVRKEGEEIVLVAGERRVKAANKVGLLTIPAIFTTGVPAEIALVENLLREDLTALEEARGLQRLKDEAGYNNNNIAKALGKSASTVSETLSILRLPQRIIEELESHPKTPKRVLVKIATLKDNKKMAGAWRHYKNSKLDPKKGTKESKGERSNPNVIAQRFILSASKSLDGFKGDLLKSEERDKVRNDLEDLQKKIKKTIEELSG
jgi:ParB family transcriptional regulator, chromosome partitioning protein